MRLKGPRRKKYERTSLPCSRGTTQNQKIFGYSAKKELGFVSPQRETLQGTQGFSFPEETIGKRTTVRDQRHNGKSVAFSLTSFSVVKYFQRFADVHALFS